MARVHRSNHPAPTSDVYADVVWINGAFGVGKTTIGTELARSWPGAILFDPELVGMLVRAMDARQADDYQDVPLWRALVARAAASLARRRAGLVVVPMTLVVPAYFAEVVGGLRRAGVHVRHFTLQATPATIHERLHQRLESTDWAAARVERCVDALEHPRFSRHVQTDGRQVQEIVTEIRAAVRSG